MTPAMANTSDVEMTGRFASEADTNHPIKSRVFHAPYLLTLSMVKNMGRDKIRVIYIRSLHEHLCACRP